MAPEPMPTGNPFPSLKEYTQGHPAGSADALKFQPDVALQLAATAEQVIMAIGMLKQFITEMTAGAPVSNLGSGTALGKKFGQKATDLDHIFDKHKTILADMIDTFIAAGKAYGKMDGFNAALLDNVSSHPTDIWEVSDVPPEHTAKPPLSTDANKQFADMSGLLSGLKSFEPSTIMGESPDAMSWLDLYQVGNFIRSNNVVTNLSDHAGNWWWMSTEVNRVFSDFTNRVDSVTADQWSGPGKEAAVAGVKAYASAIPQLASAVRGMGDLLIFSAGWLDSTQVNMPMTADNPAGTLIATGYSYSGYYGSTTYSVLEDSTPQYREAFRKTYLAGLSQSATHVPVLPPAEGGFGQIPSDPYHPGGRPDQNGGPGGGGGPHGGGGGGPQGGGGQQGGPQGGPSLSQQRAAAIADGQGLDSQQAGQLEQAQVGGQTPGTTQGSPGSPSGALGQGLSALQQLTGPDGQLAQAQAQQIAGQNPGQFSGQEEQAVSSAAQQLLSAAQQGLPQLLQCVQQLAQTLSPQQLQEALKRAGIDIPGLNLADPAQLDEALAAAGLPESALGALGGGGGGGGGGIPGGGGGGVPGSPGIPLQQAQVSKLFPRVAALSTAGQEFGVETASRAGLATNGTPGTPGSPGAAGAGAQGGQSKEHKRATYLESSEHLEDAIGEAPVVVRPVVEQ